MSRLELMSGLELLHFFRATAEADRLVLRTFYRSLRDSIATSAIQLYYSASRRGRAPHPGIWDCRRMVRETRIELTWKCNG
jgi:hypothetical protein